MMSELSRFERIKAKAVVALNQWGNAPPDDLEAARAIATAALEKWADFDEPTFARFQARGIWNDDAAVQAALVAIKMMRDELVPYLSPDRSTHSLATEVAAQEPGQ